MEESKLSFLNVRVIRKNNKFETAIFRKNTFTNLGLTYLSYELIKYKINAIYRAFNLSSTYTCFINEVSFLSEYFEKNGFPSNLIFSHVIFL